MALGVALCGVAATCSRGSTGTVRDGSNRLAARPNILLVTIDTLRADAVGAYGATTKATPTIDRLAAHGTRFESAHAQAVLTLPSHATILSARFPFAHGVRDNAGFRLSASIETLPLWLRARGYRTGAFVSAFPLDARFGLARGFDEYDDRLPSSPRPAFLEQERDGRETIARARAWLSAGDGRPSFCWVHLFEPHYPYAPPEPYASRYAANPYAGDVAAADAALAPLLQPVLDGAERGSTMVILTADHGESLGEHGESTHGIFAYEATLRVPLVIVAPGLAAGVRRDEARHVDIAPTVLDLLSLPIPSGLDGRSLRQPAAENGVSYFEALSGALNRGWAPVRGVIRAGMKFIDLPIPELYELSSDPAETKNLASTRAEEVRSLRSLLRSFPSAAVRAGRETDDASARLRALGYASGGGSVRAAYSEADDPKRLIAVDRDIQEIVADYVSGNGGAALGKARAFAARHPTMPLAWLQLAHLERESGHLSEGIECLKKAHALDRNNVQAASLLGAYLTQDNRPEEAIAILTPLSAREDADVEVLRALALATARRGQTDAALALVGRARAADPREVQLLIDEGTIALMGERRTAARSAFEQALARDPNLPRARSSLGALALDEGRPADALSQWREAVRLDASEYSRIFALGVAHARAGRTAQARVALEFFAAGAPSSPYAREIAQARSWLAGAR